MKSRPEAQTPGSASGQQAKSNEEKAKIKAPKKDTASVLREPSSPRAKNSESGFRPERRAETKSPHEVSAIAAVDNIILRWSKKDTQPTAPDTAYFQWNTFPRSGKPKRQRLAHR